jgi:replicative DNA helicase|tara:strand:+ start:2057 stop:3370 length:1314 start_codon:yes stop_codon:yes gene_type:complete
MLQDFETWSMTHKHYLPPEYHALYRIIDNHCESYHSMPTIEDLKYEIRDKVTLDKLYAIESIDVDADSYMLLQYLKNEYTQQEILKELQGYVESSIAFEDAEEAIGHLHQIVLDVETKVDLQDPSESMQSITLHEKDEDIAKYIPLGLNTEYDYDIQFSPRDLVMVGGKRGSGKSIVSCNIANSVYESGKTAIYFTIEMDSRSILQRCCSIATEVPFSRIRTKNLSITEWEKVATWWANRFLNGQEKLKQYREERNFDKFHTELKTNDQIKPNEHIDVIYDPSLTLAKIRAELDKKIKVGNVGIVIVDYINQVKRSAMPSRAGQYDWAEQIEVSKTLKAMAQEYETTIFSPYQTDASGEARFAKGILDAADAAYTINAWTQEDECVTLQCVKMRSAAEKSFTSTMDWETLKIGPGTALNPKEKEATSHATGEEINDI